MPVRVVIDYPRLERFSRRKSLEIITLAVAEVRIVARRNVLWRRYPGYPPRRLGLANSIYGTVRPRGRGFVARVGSDLPYAASVENGAAPHIIRPRAAALGGGVYRGGRYLHFYWEKVGHRVSFRKVNHPGQEGKHYLRNALLRVARRRNFRVIIY